MRRSLIVVLYVLGVAVFIGGWGAFYAAIGERAMIELGPTSMVMTILTTLLLPLAIIDGIENCNRKFCRRCWRLNPTTHPNESSQRYCTPCHIELRWGRQ